MKAPPHGRCDATVDEAEAAAQAQRVEARRSHGPSPARQVALPEAPDAGHLLEERRRADRNCRQAHRERLAARLRRSGNSYLWWDRTLSRTGIAAFVLVVLGIVLTEIGRVFTGEANYYTSNTSLLIVAGVVGLALCTLGWLGVSALYQSHDRALRAYARRNAVQVDDVETPFHP